MTVSQRALANPYRVEDIIHGWTHGHERTGAISVKRGNALFLFTKVGGHYLCKLILARKVKCH